MNNISNNTHLRSALIDDLGLSNLAMEEQNEIIERMLQVVLQRIFTETAGRLNEDDKRVYFSMIEKNRTSEEAESFVREKIPQYDNLVLEIVREFRGEMTNS